MNDFLADKRAAHWHTHAREDGTRSGASFPLLKNGNRPSACCCFFPAIAGAFSDDLVELLARLAENVSFALDNFDRAEEKARAEEQKERLTRMFAALSETNEAIMRAKTRAEMFELVCAAAVLGGKFTSTTIVLAEPGRGIPADCRFEGTKPPTCQKYTLRHFRRAPRRPRIDWNGVPDKSALHHE